LFGASGSVGPFRRGRKTLSNNYWLIKPNHQDLDPLHSFVGRVKNNISNILGTKTVSLFFVYAMIFAPLVSNAGIFSSVLALFESKKAQNATSLYVNDTNSQKISILDAPLNFDPEAGRGGAEITTVGDSALLSQTGPSGSITDIKDVPKSGQISVYVVREGDTLSQIASIFGVSTNTILWANDIPSNGTIRVGQVLTILPISGVRHEVKKGETLRSIVSTYKGHLEEVMSYNGLTSDSLLAVGDIVMIPDGEIKAVTTKQVSRPTSSSGPSYDGYYLRPISGGTRTQGIHGYNGVDLATYAGAPIFAAADGVVIVSKNSGWNGGYGNYVVIKHSNGTQTLYAHNSENIVYVGQNVVKGQVVGYIGSTGKSTGPHLHFEIRGAKNPF